MQYRLSDIQRMLDAFESRNVKQSFFEEPEDGTNCD